MNILYISHLSKNISAGPAWSVPASVKAQSKIDNVMWLNITDSFLPHWGDITGYHNLKEYKSFDLQSLPAPFDKPDIVVFEGFYNIQECFFAKKIKAKGIPYIIIPRGSLTHQALHNKKWLKKKIAHWLFFDSFAKNASAIQYLTSSEFEDSTTRWNNNNFIIPNGCNTPKNKKENFSTNAIKAIFIGRLDMYHKGLDILLSVLDKMQEQLRKANFSLILYGPQRHDYIKLQNIISDMGIADIVSLGGEISGENKERAILDADLMIMTSRFEGHPMGLVETLSYGLPCLISRGTNMLSEVQESMAGWTCETNEESVGIAIQQMLNERASLPERGKNAYQLAKLYNWDTLAERFHEELSKILINVQ